MTCIAHYINKGFPLSELMALTIDERSFFMAAMALEAERESNLLHI